MSMIRMQPIVESFAENLRNSGFFEEVSSKGAAVKIRGCVGDTPEDIKDLIESNLSSDKTTSKLVSGVDFGFDSSTNQVLASINLCDKPIDKQCYGGDICESVKMMVSDYLREHKITTADDKTALNESSDVIDTKYFKNGDLYYQVTITPDQIDDIYDYDEGFNLHFYDARNDMSLEKYPENLSELVEDCRGSFDEEALRAFAAELADNTGAPSVAEMLGNDAEVSDVMNTEDIPVDDIVDYMTSVDPEDLDNCPSFYSLFKPNMPVRYVEPAGYYEGGGLEFSHGYGYDGHVYILKSETTDVPDERIAEFVRGQKEELKAYCDGEIYGVTVNRSNGTNESEGGILGNSELDEIISEYVGRDAEEITEDEYYQATGELPESTKKPIKESDEDDDLGGPASDALAEVENKITKVYGGMDIEIDDDFNKEDRSFVFEVHNVEVEDGDDLMCQTDGIIEMFKEAGFEIIENRTDADDIEGSTSAEIELIVKWAGGADNYDSLHQGAYESAMDEAANAQPLIDKVVEAALAKWNLDAGANEHGNVLDLDKDYVDDFMESYRAANSKEFIKKDWRACTNENERYSEEIIR